MSAKETDIGPIAVTMGEPAGIGIEITLRAWLARRSDNISPFCCYGCAVSYRRTAEVLGLDVPIATVSNANEAATHFDHGLPVVDLPLAEPFEFGVVKASNASRVIASIDAALAAVRGDTASSLVTNPIQKDALWAAGFQHPGHTEYLASTLAETAAPKPPVMMLSIDGLRVAPVTIHIPLRDVPHVLTGDKIKTVCRTAHLSLMSDFGIESPRLAVAALNPHAGEGGGLGREEIEVIQPAIADLRSEGLDVVGPYPADTLFHAAARKVYDIAICMYHDQALIPLKTLDFDNGVNITLGLPITRTSPDHGTALDIAGRGDANPASLIAALKTAQDIAQYKSLRTDD